MSNREINQYFEQIKIFLPTFSKSTKRYLKDLRNSIDDYCKENPNSSMDDIIEELGLRKMSYVTILIVWIASN